MFNSRITMMLICAGVSGGLAFGNINILVNNPSFEILPSTGLPYGGCGASCSYSNGPIPGWMISSGGGGQFQPGFQMGNYAYYSNGASDGTITSAYSNVGVISQIVGLVGQAGTVYTMSVDIGGPRNDNYPALGSADLFINGNTYSASGVTAARGLWSTWTATYTSSLADVGSSIEIDLNSSGSQGNYDNVTLSATPEPGFYGFLTLGFSGLALAVKRRRAA